MVINKVSEDICMGIFVHFSFLLANCGSYAKSLFKLKKLPNFSKAVTFLFLLVYWE